MKRSACPYGWIPAAGVALLAAWLPLLGLPSLRGGQVVLFLCSFAAAGLAYGWAIWRLRVESPSPWLLWGFAVAFRLALLTTPVSLSDDVFRYIWDGHLLTQGLNPYALAVQSPLLDAYATPLRALVNFPWMATPYLPAAQSYFALVEQLAPQNPFAFQVASVLLDLATAAILARVLARLNIPAGALLIYLWNPLVIMEFAHGAHIDALMLFWVAAALWGLLAAGRRHKVFSALALAAGVLVKGWPILLVPLFLPRWKIKEMLVFGVATLLPILFFAAGAGWGLSGLPDGQGLFGALRIFTTRWNFNAGLYIWLAQGIGPQAARLFSVAAPGLLALHLGWRSWRAQANAPSADLAAADRNLVRAMLGVLGLYLLLAPTIHPWYLTLALALLPFIWPAAGEAPALRRWIWPWVYFMALEAGTYLAYSGLTPPGQAELESLQTLGYLPLWLLLLWAAGSQGRFPLDFSRILLRIKEDKDGYSRGQS